jgi:hypothetical protein
MGALGGRLAAIAATLATSIWFFALYFLCDGRLDSNHFYRYGFLGFVHYTLVPHKKYHQ